MLLFAGSAVGPLSQIAPITGTVVEPHLDPVRQHLWVTGLGPLGAAVADDPDQCPFASLVAFIVVDASHRSFPVNGVMDGLSRPEGQVDDYEGEPDAPRRYDRKQSEFLDPATERHPHYSMVRVRVPLNPAALSAAFTCSSAANGLEDRVSGVSFNALRRDSRVRAIIWSPTSFIFWSRRR